MEVGQIVEVKDRNCTLFKARGVIANIRPKDMPWDNVTVMVEGFDGRKFQLEAAALKRA